MLKEWPTAGPKPLWKLAKQAGVDLAVIEVRGHGDDGGVEQVVLGQDAGHPAAQGAEDGTVRHVGRWPLLGARR